ncbi:MAG TPA: gluconokinase [bacterium]|nr:gluconokinase [bacterium]
MIIVVMGVAGSGKTTVGRKLASVLGFPFFDADDDHPEANKRKMAAGVPLQDSDRQPWLEIIAEEINQMDRRGSSAVWACSALKQKYRDTLSSGVKVIWVYLKGDKELIRQRLGARKGHFMSPELLDSQFAALEEPKEAIVLDITRDSDKIVQELVEKLKLA